MVTSVKKKKFLFMKNIIGVFFFRGVTAYIIISNINLCACIFLLKGENAFPSEKIGRGVLIYVFDIFINVVLEVPVA